MVRDPWGPASVEMTLRHVLPLIQPEWRTANVEEGDKKDKRIRAGKWKGGCIRKTITTLIFDGSLDQKVFPRQ
jgi:hypothetical protein